MIFYRNNKNLLSPEYDRIKIILLIMFATLTLQLSLDMYLPSMPAMQNYFATSRQMIQYTLLIYLLATGFTQLFYGPLIDHYGRRSIILIAMFFFFLASLGCIQTSNIHWFLVWRCIQGAADGAVYVAYRATIRDLFGQHKLTKVISYASMAWVVVPIVAPFLGGYIEHYFGWRMNFTVIFILSAGALILLWHRLPETKPIIARNVIIQTHLVKKYTEILKQPLFTLSVIGIMFINSIMLCYNLISPFLLQNGLQLNPVEFGWTAMFVTIGYMLGSFISGKLIGKLSQTTLVLLAVTITLTSAISFCLLASLNIHTVSAIIIPVFISYFGIGVTYPNLVAITLEPFSYNVGTASAIQGTIQTGFAVIISFSATILPHDSARPLSYLFVLFSILTLLAFIGVRRIKA